ncbi:unnamed protein product [Allacma fusca]|uniref:CRAL-TRIO domain-containing protein n=1 Tax=Allacma fusca TaxID=39272 RepID=A0A8J2JVU9_9HEXA|nr:unnamed protein product [Allacma fusca]
MIRILIVILLTGTAGIEGQTEIIEGSDKLHLRNSIESEPRQDAGLSEAAYKKVYSYTKNTNAFKDFSYEQMKARILNTSSWVPPAELQKSFPYYHAGYDYEKRPVWVAEIGKFDFRDIVAKGDKSIVEAKRYLFQAVLNGIFSIAAMDTEEQEIKDTFVIFDMEGASIKQLNFLPSWVQFAELFGKYWDLVFQLLGRLVIINANYVTKLATDIARPVVGQLMERVEVYGVNRNVWLPRLLKHMPIEAIPSWYGGKKNFKPISIHG